LPGHHSLARSSADIPQASLSSMQPHMCAGTPERMCTSIHERMCDAALGRRRTKSQLCADAPKTSLTPLDTNFAINIASQAQAHIRTCAPSLMRLNIKGILYYQADGSLIPVYVTANDPNLTLNEIPRSFRTGNASERLRNKPPPELRSTMETFLLCNDSPGNQEGDRFPGEVILVNIQASCLMPPLISLQ